MDGLWNIIKVTLLLVALVILVPMSMRRVVRPRGGRGYRLQVMDSISCGGNRLICMVRCDDRELIVGVTDAQISVLSTQEATEASEEIPLAPTGVTFLEQLKGMVRRGRGDSTP